MFESQGVCVAALKRLTCACVLAASGLLLFSGSSRADDTTIAPVATTPSVPLVESGLTAQAIGSETGSVESNPLMLIQKSKSLIGSTTSPELILNDSTPLTQFSADTLINENLFNETNFNSTDVHSNINLATQNQRWTTAIQAKTDYDTTRTSELSTYGNISTTPVRHTGFSLTPQASFSPTEIDKFSLLTNLLVTQYGSSIYSNYEQASVTPTYSHNFDPRNAGTFGLQAQEYKTTNGTANKVDSLGPSVGWVATLTPRLTAKATVGAQESRQYQEGVPSKGWSLDYIYSVDIGFKGEQDTTDLIANRSEYPFGNGTESLLTSFSLTEIHLLNPRLSINFGAGYQSGTYQVDTSGSLQSYWNGSGGLTYHVTQHLDATTAYQYRYETLTNTSGNAQDHIFTLGIVYHPQAWAL